MLLISLLYAPSRMGRPAYVSTGSCWWSLHAAPLAALGGRVGAQPGGGGGALRHATRSRRSGSRCPLNTIRCTGARLGELGRRRDAARGAPGLTLLATTASFLAALIYYVRPHPFGAVEWNPVPGTTSGASSTTSGPTR